MLFYLFPASWGILVLGPDLLIDSIRQPNLHNCQLSNYQQHLLSLLYSYPICHSMINVHLYLMESLGIVK